MRAVLTNLGSLGNIQPFVALASELRKHGHQPVLALAPGFAPYASQLGFDFVPIGLDLDYPKLQRKDTEDALKGVDPINTLNDSLAKLSAMLPQMLEQLSAACQGSDVLISGHLQPASRMLHELTGIPFVSIHTNHFGGMQPEAYRSAAGKVINPFRQKHGLASLDDPIHTDANSPQLALYAISRLLRTPDSHWPPNYHVTGFFFLEERHFRPDPELVRFLENGRPPVVISFSSIVHPDPEATTDLLLEAVRLAGCRAIIQHGWSGLGRGRVLPPDVFSVGFVQHTWLFPHAACVVHAGGSGTPATTLKAGVPAIVVPHVGDQPMWAELVRGLGCAGDVIPYHALSPYRLAAAIERTLSDVQLYRTAADIASAIRAEQGVSRARLLIEQMLDRLSSQSIYHHAGVNTRNQLQQYLRARKSQHSTKPS